MKNCALPVSSGADLRRGGGRLYLIHHQLICCHVRVHKVVTRLSPDCDSMVTTLGMGVMHQVHLAGADENPINYSKTICKECWLAEKYNITALNFIIIQYRHR